MIQQNFITIKSPHNQHSSCKFKRKYFDSQSKMSVYNSKLLIMSVLMLHPYITKFFSNPMHQETVRYITRRSEHTGVILAPPWNFLTYCYNLQSPQGLITELLFFSTAIISTVLSFMQLCC